MKEKKSINQIDIHFLHTVEMDKFRKKPIYKKKCKQRLYCGALFEIFARNSI